MAAHPNNPDPIEAAKHREGVRLLRLACRMSASSFSLLLGMPSGTYTAKEKGKLAFRPEEFDRAKKAVAEHLATARKTLDSVPN